MVSQSCDVYLQIIQPCHSLGASNEPPTCAGNDDDTDKCKMFIERTCGCRLANGSPCSSLFSVDEYASHHYQASLLTRNELDLVLTGSMMSLVNTQSNTSSGKHKPTKRSRTFTNFLHGGQHVCQQTYRFFLGIGKDRLTAVKQNYLSNGLATRVHGNAGRLPHNVTSFETIKEIVQFVSNYAEEHAILLPGRIPRYKKDDIKLLPSSTSKKVHTFNKQT